MNTALRSWLRDDAEPAADRARQVGRIMGRVDEIRQRRRLWPLNPFGRRAVHSATGTEGAILATRGRTAAIVPLSALTAVALTVLVTVSLMWVASRPIEQRLVPGGWVVDPADQALFEGFATLWAGKETDLATTQEVYADGAVFDQLWLDEEEVVSGNAAIGSYMRDSANVDQANAQLIPLPAHFSGARRYLLVPASAGATFPAGTACVLWVKDDRIARHDCILPTAIDGVALQAMVAPTRSAVAEREELSVALSEALAARDRATLERMMSAEITHHVLSTNQVYTLEGIDQYWSVMGYGGITNLTNADLPAPESEVRWANFSTVGSGTLCVFSARDGLVTRHDCIVPSATTVSEDLTEIGTPPGV